MKIFAIFTLILLASTFSNGQENQWVQKSPMPTARSDLSALAWNNMILVAGGCIHQVCPPDLTFCSCQAVTDTLEAYFPQNDSWISLASLPRPRFRHGAAVIQGSMFLLGGRDVFDNILTQVDVYDIGTNTWRIEPSMYWGNATSDNVVVAVGASLYAIGGYNTNYDSLNVTCVWTSAGGWNCDSVAPMIQGRGDACGVSNGSEILVLGGFSDVNFCSALNSLEVYDIANNVWRHETHLHSPRADPGCALLHGLFHAVGGEQKSNVTGCNKYDIPIRDVEYYTSNDTWIEETPLPDARFRFAAVTFGDSLYLIGGQGTVNAQTYVQPVLQTVSLYSHTPDASASMNQLSYLCMFLLLVSLAM